MRRYGGVLLGLVLCLALGARPARGQSLDLELWRLGDPGVSSPADAQKAFVGNTQVLVPYDPRAQERFARFTSDLGLAIAPLPAGLSSSAGDAGLDIAFTVDFAQIHPIQKFSDGTYQYVWPTAQVPGSTMILPTLHIRKGLPLSWQIGVDVSYIANSTMFAPSAWLQWSLTEGLRWIPDVHVRALGTVLLGSSDLEEIVAGWDAGASYKIPIYGHVVMSVYAGYQQLGLSASTQNINFDPKYDNTNATSQGMSAQLSTSNVFTPMYYGNPIDPTTRLWRVYFGGQIKWSILLIGADFAYGAAHNRVDQSGDGVTTDYFIDTWKADVRIGLLF